jgi:uncharacterized protein YdeI (YjbR/CyaY-like superfamily)
MAADPPVKSFASQDAWERWLDRNHGKEEGVWLKVAKKASGKGTVTVPEALEISLCYGWIDGQRKALDEDYFLQRFTPRRLRSRWSRINRDSATALIEQGRMRPAGLAEVERAKADGRWDAAYASVRTMEVPADLQRELDARPQAAAFFATLNSQNRYSILYRLHDAKRPETRARRLEKFVAMLEAGETLY